jgi:hypothetical protein
MTEAKSLTPLAVTAFTLLSQNFQTAAAGLAGEVLANMGLKAEDGWRVNFEAKQVERTVADPA